ncbi:MAG: right-handed parallel beta-helix repeat-containing protein [Planctomycetia bacterium]|nr:right-handed parallel beta-helix repeat-containing protein [Planctomycetia bacterium]
MMRKKLCPTLLLLLPLFQCCMCWSASVRAADFMVSPVSDLKTFDDALNAVREFRKTHPNYDQPVRVSFSPGVYFIERTIVLDDSISGTKLSPTIFQSSNGGEVVFSGGVLLKNWSVNEKGWWEITLAKKDFQTDNSKYRSGDSTVPENSGFGSNDNPFTQLFVNDQRRFRPRLPKKGYFHIAETLPPTDFVEGGEKKRDNRFRFGETNGKNDIPSTLQNAHQVEVLTTHHWNASRLPIAKIDAENRILEMKGRVTSSAYWASFMKDHCYLLDNVGDALSDPGEWYFDDSRGTLTYIPREGETQQNTTIIVPRVQFLLTLQNARHVQLQGLTFAHGAWSFPEFGMHHAQAESGLYANVNLQNAQDCTFENCCIRHCGAYALKIDAQSARNTFDRCDVFDIGGGGIFVCGNHNKIIESTFAHLGRIHPAGIGVFIQRASHNTVQNCDVYDLYYSSVSIGWSWGYQPSSANHNVVAWNHFHTIGQGLLSDMGAVYTLGISPGTRVEYNRIHDVESFGYGGWGLYTDEGSTGIVMRGNIVYRTKSASFHQHYGKENVIENNIFVNARENQLQRTRTEEHTSFFLRKNIIYFTSDQPIFGSNWRDDNFVCDYNLYYNPHKSVEFPTEGKNWREERGFDVHSIVNEDPLFVDLSNDDFRLKPESPAWKLGFEAIPDKTMGRTSPSRVSRYPAVPSAYSNPKE